MVLISVNFRPKRLRAALTALLGSLSVDGKAATISWANTNTDFSLGSSWTGGVAPADSLTTDVASFATASPTFQPSLSANRSLTGLTFASGAGAFTFGGNGTLSLGATGITNASSNLQTLTLPLRLGANSTFTVSGTGNLTVGGTLDTAGRTLTLTGTGTGTGRINGVISGAGSLVKTGSRTWILAGANTFSGNTTLTAGTLTAAHDSALGTGTLWLNGGTLSANATRTLTNAALLSANSTLGGAAALTLSGPVTLNGNRTLTVSNTALTTLSGGLGETGGSQAFTKAGIGTLALGGLGTYTGPTAVTAGTLSFDTIQSIGGGASALGAPTTLSAGQILLGSGTTAVNLLYTGAGSTSDRGIALVGTTGAISLNASGTGALVLSGNITAPGAGTKTLTLTGNNTAANTLSGIIADNSPANRTAITKSGTGTWRLTAANTHSGNTTLAAGTLSLGHNQALGSSLLVLSGGTLTADTIPLTLTNAVALNGSTLTLAGNQSLTFTGNTTNILAGNPTLTVSNSAATTLGDLALSNSATSRTLTLSVTTTAAVTGVISNGGSSTASGLTKTGAGTLLLSGSNTYAGNTTLSAGTLALGHNQALGTGTLLFSAGTLSAVAGSPLTVANPVSLTGGTLALGGNQSLTLTGNVTNTFAGNPALTIANSALTTLGNFALSNTTTNRTLTLNVTTAAAISGVISNGNSTASALTKTGAGTLTLSGNNTYAGLTTLSAGTLRATTSAAALGAGPLTLTAGTLELANNTPLAFGRNTTLAGNVTIRVDTLSANPGLTHSLGTLTTATSTLTVAPGAQLTANTPYGLTFGNVTLAGSPATFAVANNGNATGTLCLGSLSNTAASRGFTLNGTGTVLLTAAAGTLSSGTGVTVNRGTLRAGATNTFGSLALVNLTLNALASDGVFYHLDGFDQALLSLTIGGTGGTPTSFAQVTTGTGTLTLGGNVNVVATGNPLGSSLSGLLSLGTATRTFTIADSTSATTELTVDAAISGTGGLTKAGAGRLDLTGTNTYSGNTSLSAGTLGLGGNATLGSGTLSITNGTTLVAVGGPRTLPNVVIFASNAGLTIAGPNALTFAGNTTLAGTNVLTAPQAPVRLTGLLSGTGGLSLPAGNGTFEITGANTYSGATTINTTLTLSNLTGSATGTSALTIGTLGTLTGAGRVTGSVTVNGRISPGATVGTLQTGAQTWNGGGRYVWDLNNATGTAGASPGWDRLSLAGGLTIAATNLNRFVLDLRTLDLTGAPGLAANFNPALTTSWTILTATGSITGFSPDRFTIGRTDFLNTAPGSFSLSVSGSNLLLTYTAVPETAPGIAFGLLLAAAILARRRRRCSGGL